MINQCGTGSNVAAYRFVGRLNCRSGTSFRHFVGVMLVVICVMLGTVSPRALGPEPAMQCIIGFSERCPMVTGVLP